MRSLARVSVIVPAYNAAGSLAGAVGSIRAQRCAVDVTVIDDGSTDATAQIARAAGVRVRHQENRGPSAARNAGLAGAEELVAFLDADDLWPAHSLAARLRYLHAHPEIDIVQGHIQDLWPGLGVAGRDRLDPPRTGFNLGCALFRRAVFDAVGPFDESLRTGEDIDLLVRAEAHGHRRHLIPDVTLLYRRRPHRDVGAYRRHVANLAGAIKRTLDARRRRED